MKKKEGNENLSKQNPKIDVQFRITDIDYNTEKKAISDFMIAINLFHLNDYELRFNGERLFEIDELSNFESLPSPFKAEILQHTISVCKLLFPPLKAEEFKIKHGIDNLDKFLNEKWSFYRLDGYVYDLVPDTVLTPNKLTHYKFFLPFRLRHCEPDNVSDILYYHRDQYYQDIPQAFFSIVLRIVQKRDSEFWYKNETHNRIQDWLSENQPDTMKKLKLFWFEFLSKHDHIKKSFIGSLYRQLKSPDHAFIDSSVDYNDFSAIFYKPTFYRVDFKKVNWIGSLGELNYFINRLKNEISSGKIWETSAKLFLVDGNSISPVKIMNNRSITKARSDQIDSIFITSIHINST